MKLCCVTPVASVSQREENRLSTLCTCTLCQKGHLVVADDRAAQLPVYNNEYYALLSCRLHGRVAVATTHYWCTWHDHAIVEDTSPDA